MTNSKSTKRALLTSALAMLMCVAMLIGTTFAWFTDTASTAVNKIQAGKLDVALEMKNPDYGVEGKETSNQEWISAEDKTLEFKKAADAAEGEAVLWEPGCTYELPELRVVNNGNLALKYKVIISGIKGNAKLNEVIDWTITLDDSDYVVDAEHSLAAKTETATDSDIFTIKGHMQETAGNDYQDLTIDGIAITVVATQDTVEYDSNNKTYDALAQYPVYTVADVETETNESGVTTVATALTINSKETTTVNEQTVSVATATIPADVVLDTGTTQVKLVVEDSKDTNNISITSDQAKKTLEVKLEGVSASNTVPATVSFYIESGLTGLVLYHNNTEMAAVNSVNDLAEADDNSYYYDSSTGKITMKSAKYSPFTYVYDAPGTVTVRTEKELRTALFNAPTDGSDVKIVLQNDITLDLLYAAPNLPDSDVIQDYETGDTLNRYKKGVHPTSENPNQWNTLVTDQTAEERAVYGAYYHTGANDERIARLVVKANQDVIIDLNGHTIEKDARATYGDWSNTFTDIIANYGKLKIVDSATGGKVVGRGYTSCKGAVLHNYAGTMIVENVEVDGNAAGMTAGTGQYVIANDGGTVVIDGTNVHDTATSASLVVNTAGKMTIKGSATLQHPSTKNIYVKGGEVFVESATIISDIYAIYAKGGTVEVTDASVTVDGNGTMTEGGGTITHK